MISPEARKLLREFNRDLERQRRWDDFYCELRHAWTQWFWLAYLAVLVGGTFLLWGWL